MRTCHTMASQQPSTSSSSGVASSAASKSKQKQKTELLFKNFTREINAADCKTLLDMVNPLKGAISNEIKENIITFIQLIYEEKMGIRQNTQTESNQLEMQVKNLSLQLQNFDTKLENIQKSIKNNSNKQEAPKTFASIVQKNIAPIITAKTTTTATTNSQDDDHSTVVCYSNSNNNSDNTLAYVQQNFCPTENRISVKSCKKLSNGKLLISFKSRQDMDNFFVITQDDPTISFEGPKRRWPLLLFLNVDKKFKVEGLFRETIFACNKDIDELDDKITNTEILDHIYTKNGKSEDLVSVAYKVHPRLYKLIMVDMNGFISLNYSRIKVITANPIRQCYKCMAYGHVSGKCPAQSSFCSQCCGNHSYKECPNRQTTPKCINCTRAGLRDNKHNAKDNVNCQVYQRIVKSIINKTDYW